MKKLVLFSAMLLALSSCGEEEQGPRATISYYNNDSSCGYLISYTPENCPHCTSYAGTYSNELPENVKQRVRDNGSAVVEYSTMNSLNQPVSCGIGAADVHYDHVQLQNVSLIQ